MESEAPDQIGPRAPPDAAQHSLVRSANEAVMRNLSAAAAGGLIATRCECGDAACEELVQVTHEEYEAVRSYGSHFVIRLNHENPESSWVLRENERFAVIDVVVGDARYQVLARNPRHAWVDV
jgi:hypothetical protein